jgi:hypothetical protein
MGDVINLRRARKARARDAAASQAERNRAAFGRTRLEKREAADDMARHARLLDGAKRDE